MVSTLLAELVRAARQAGLPAHDLVIAAEGNVSLTTEDGRFFVTRSGARLGELEEIDLVELDSSVLLAGLDSADGDASWLDVLTVSKIDPAAQRPSVEAGLHAVLASYYGAGVILHTHPTAALAVMASGRMDAFARARVLPDEIVMCGTMTHAVPYLDPGVALARHVRAMLDSEPEVSPTWLLENHGIVCAATTAVGALESSLMLAKCARVFCWAGAADVSGMPTAEIARIAGREDEKYRQSLLGVRSPSDPPRERQRISANEEV
jgi:rhamnose utilization protein RhaD (predicted bifunctional aldolase and dehydrogenase)